MKETITIFAKKCLHNGTLVVKGRDTCPSMDVSF